MNFSELHPNIRIRLIVDFIQRIFNNMIIPFMAIYLANHFGIKTAGILMFFAIFCGVISSFYGGYYSDVKGRKKILLISELSNFIIFIFMAFSNSPWFTFPFITYILYVFHNVVVYSSTPAKEAMLIDVSTPETRKSIYSINYWVINLSFSIGSIAGAFFYKNYFFEILLISSLATLIIFFIYMYLIEETKPGFKDNKEVSKINIGEMFQNYKYVLTDKLFLMFVIASLLLMSIELQLANYISVRLTNEFESQKLLNLIHITGVKMYGILRAENTILVVILAFVTERLVKKVSDVKRLLIGPLIFTIGYMVVGTSNTVWILLSATFFFTLGEMIYVPVKQTLLSVLIDESSRTQYMAVYSLHFRVALMIASFCITLGGFIPSIGMSIIYGVLGIISISIFQKLVTLKSINSQKTMESQKTS